MPTPEHDLPEEVEHERDKDETTDDEYRGTSAFTAAEKYDVPPEAAKEIEGEDEENDPLSRDDDWLLGSSD